LPGVFWSLTWREFDLLVQNFNNKIARENSQIWWTARLIIDQLGAMFSKDHHPITLEEWTRPPEKQAEASREEELAKKRRLLNAMEWGLKVGIAAPKIEELRREIEDLENDSRAKSQDIPG
jgi:hypothetical protein